MGAPAFQDFAEKLQDGVDNGSSTLVTVQISLCVCCLLACRGRAFCMSRLEQESEVNRDRGTASREELKPIRQPSDKAEQSESESESGQYKEFASTPVICLVVTAFLDAILLALERPVTSWAVGGAYKSYFAFRFIIGLLPWSMIAPTIMGHTFSSPYELMVPIGFAAFLIGGLLVVAKQKG